MSIMTCSVMFRSEWDTKPTLVTLAHMWETTLTRSTANSWQLWRTTLTGSMAPRDLYWHWWPTSTDRPGLGHHALRFKGTKKLTGSDFISSIKKVYLHNFKLLNCFLDLLWNFEDLKNVVIHFVYNQTEPEIQPWKTLYLWLGTGPPVKP